MQIQKLAVLASILSIAVLGVFWSHKKLSADANDHVKEVTAEQLKADLAAGNVVVINVLSEKYFNDCHIKNSVNISLGNLVEEASNRWSKDQYIVVYCASYQCSASKSAYHKLTNAGFTNVRAYEGGTKEWKQKGFACVGPCQESYLE